MANSISEVVFERDTMGKEEDHLIGWHSYGVQCDKSIYFGLILLYITIIDFFQIFHKACYVVLVLNI